MGGAGDRAPRQLRLAVRFEAIQTLAIDDQRAMAPVRPLMPSALTGDIIVHPLFAHALAKPPQATTPPPWLHLPRACLLQVASSLAAADLAALAACSRELRDLASDEAVWEALCRRTFPGVPPRGPPPGGWRALYKWLHQMQTAVFAEGGGQRRRGGGGWPSLSRGAGAGPIRILAGTG